MSFGREHRNEWRGITRIVLLVLLVVFVVLLLHFLMMGSAHQADSGCATCLTVMTASLLLVAWLMTAWIVDLRPWVARSGPVIAGAPAAVSRDSPTRTVVLRL